jgi:hypothetical protein
MLALEGVKQELATQLDDLSVKMDTAVRRAAEIYEDVHYGESAKALRREVQNSISNGRDTLDNMYASLRDLEGGCL